jgi:hypothetical protein
MARPHQIVPRRATSPRAKRVPRKMSFGQGIGRERRDSKTTTTAADRKKMAPSRLRTVVGCHSEMFWVTLASVARPAA